MAGETKVRRSSGTYHDLTLQAEDLPLSCHTSTPKDVAQAWKQARVVPSQNHGGPQIPRTRRRGLPELT